MPRAVSERLALGAQLRVSSACRAVARQLGFSLCDEGLIADQVCLRLLQRGFKRPAIDREEHLALFHEVAFVEVGRLQDAGDLRAHRNCGVRFDVADRGKVDRHITFDDLGRDNRDGAGVTAASASPATAAAGTSRRT